MTELRKTACLISVLALTVARSASAGEQNPLPAGNSLGVSTGQPVPGMHVSPLIPDLAIGNNPSLGKPDAPVTMVEFIDYQCGYCQGYARATFPKIKANYIDTGKLRYVARDFPLAKHRRARAAATAAACAREQGRFWEMHDALFSADDLTDETIKSLGQRLDLDVPKFEACRTELRHGPRLDADFMAAGGLGVSGTPSFLIGPTSGEVAKGKLLQGDRGYAGFEKVIEAFLAPEKPAQ